MGSHAGNEWPSQASANTAPAPTEAGRQAEETEPGPDVITPMIRVGGREGEMEGRDVKERDSLSVGVLN